MKHWEKVDIRGKPLYIAVSQTQHKTIHHHAIQTHAYIYISIIFHRVKKGYDCHNGRVVALKFTRKFSGSWLDSQALVK